MVTALLLDFIVCKKIISAQECDCRKQDSALELNEYEKAAYDSWKAYGTNSDAVVMKVMNIHGVRLRRHVK